MLLQRVYEKSEYLANFNEKRFIHIFIIMFFRSNEKLYPIFYNICIVTMCGNVNKKCIHIFLFHIYKQLGQIECVDKALNLIIWTNTGTCKQQLLSCTISAILFHYYVPRSSVEY